MGITGPAGPPGLQGIKGETGVQGPSGQKGERGDVPPGLMSHRNWKECVWKNLNEENDNGLIKVIDFCRMYKTFIYTRQ